MPLEDSLIIAEIQDEIMKQMGIKYVDWEEMSRFKMAGNDNRF